MHKFRLERNAKSQAIELGMFYGWSVISPGWYVGEYDELKNIGVLEPLW